MKKEWFNKNRNILTAVLCGIGLCLFCVGIILLFPNNKKMNKNNNIKEIILGDESHCAERNPDNSCKRCETYFELENGECVLSCDSDHKPNTAGDACVCKSGYENTSWECVSCNGNDEYRTIDDNGVKECWKCPTGSSANSDHTGCICENGYENESHECVACTGSNQYRTIQENGIKECWTCPTGSSANSDHTDCICENGKYFDYENDQCVTCTGSNQYHFENICRTCNATGEIANSDHTDCICENGGYLDVESSQCVTSCNGSDKYIYTYSSGKKTCESCPVGTVATANNMDFVCENSGYLWDVDNSECVATCDGVNQIVYTKESTGVQRCGTCPSGEVANNDHTACVSASSPTSSPSPIPVITPSPIPVITSSPTPDETPSPTIVPTITIEPTTVPEEPESTIEPIETPVEPHQEVETGACYKDSLGYYYWGDYEDDPDYVLEPTITSEDMCKYEISSVPRTDANVSKLVYVFMAVLMGFGIGFIYYSAKLKRSK